MIIAEGSLLNKYETILLVKSPCTRIGLYRINNDRVNQMVFKTHL